MDDFDELVASLTLRENNEAIKLYQNTVALACPTCEEPFDDAVVCKDSQTSLNLSEPLDICTGVHEGKPVIFTHKP